MTRQVKLELVKSDPRFFLTQNIWTQKFLEPKFCLELKLFWAQNALENGVWLWRWPNLLCLLIWEHNKVGLGFPDQGCPYRFCHGGMCLSIVGGPEGQAKTHLCSHLRILRACFCRIIMIFFLVVHYFLIS